MDTEPIEIKYLASFGLFWFLGLFFGMGMWRWFGWFTFAFTDCNPF